MGHLQRSRNSNDLRCLNWRSLALDQEAQHKLCRSQPLLEQVTKEPGSQACKAHPQHVGASRSSFFIYLMEIHVRWLTEFPWGCSCFPGSWVPNTLWEPCRSSPAIRQHLHSKSMAGSQVSTSANICCHKSIQKQDAPLTFNISVLGLLIHYETVINVTEMQIRTAALWEAVKVPYLPPGSLTPLHATVTTQVSCLPAQFFCLFVFYHSSFPLLPWRCLSPSTMSASPAVTW